MSRRDPPVRTGGSEARRAAQNNLLLGRLDLSIAEAQMGQRELAVVKASVVALEEDVLALQEEVRYERDTSAAARRRANVIERQMADSERQVHTRVGRCAKLRMFVERAAIASANVTCMPAAVPTQTHLCSVPVPCVCLPTSTGAYVNLTSLAGHM